MVRIKFYYLIFLIEVLVLSVSNAQILQWGFNLGSSGSDEGKCIARDANGNIYVGGYFNSTIDFDPGPDTFNLTSNGYIDCFVAKYDSLGNFIFAKSFGGNLGESVLSLALDEKGNCYLAGYFRDTADFDPGPGIHILKAKSSFDTFVMKLDSVGNFKWVKKMGGNSQADLCMVQTLKIDASHHVILSGRFQGTIDFDPGNNVKSLTSTSASADDFFVCKLDSYGSFKWVKGFGGTGNQWVNDMDVSPSNEIFLTGTFSGTLDFDPNTGIHNLNDTAGGNGYIIKLSENGQLDFAKNFGPCLPFCISIDHSGNIILGGSFNSVSDFMPGAGKHVIAPKGNLDCFITKLDSQAKLIWISCFSGGGAICSPVDIAIDASDNIFTTGTFADTIDFDPGPLVYNQVANRNGPLYNEDIFISKLDSAGNFSAIYCYGGLGDDYPASICVDTFNNIYTAGSFCCTAIDLDPGYHDYFVYSAGTTDAIIQKLGPNCVPAKGTLTLMTNDTICSGDTAMLQVTGVNMYVFYKWYKNGVLIPGKTNNFLKVTDSGSYTVTMIPQSNCKKTIGPVTIYESALPFAAITSSGPTTFCAGDSVILTANSGSGLTYKWKKNNTNISGANQIDYTAKQSGNYKCVVTNSPGCKYTSNVIPVTVNCRNDLYSENSSGILMPNPADDFAELHFFASGSYVTYEVIDNTGRLIVSGKENTTPGIEDNLYFETTGLDAGIYMVSIQCGRDSQILKLIVEH